ncbi:MAG: RNA polymerase-associated protein RapA [Fibrobacteraceae bacterium]
MSSFKIGQRYISEQEPELGVGRVRLVEFKNVSLEFPAVSQTRIYRTTSAPLKRYLLTVGENAKNEKGISFAIENVKMVDDLAVYCGRGGREMKEADLQPKATPRVIDIFSSLIRGRTVDNKEFRRREIANELSCEWQGSPVRGMIGPRVNLIPHQYYLCRRACSGSILPRLMLSDEVGLGKTIEAGMIWHALHSTGRVVRTLILVPESLKHQWMAEMMRRFNHVFTLVDEGYTRALITSNGDNGEVPNPFMQENDIICTVEFLMSQPALTQDFLNATWDLTVVDEAHHLVCEDGFTSKEYLLVNSITSRTKGLLLLTGTPLQLHPESHFNRLRMLDPAHFTDFDEFLKNEESYRKIAQDLSKLPTDSEEPMSWEALNAVLPKNSPIRAWLEKENSREMTAGEWIRRIVDALGTGSVVFRNTRRGVGGFPKRSLDAVEIKAEEEYRKYVAAAVAKDPDHSIDIQENGLLATDYRDGWVLDERILWLNDFLNDHKDDKVLLICEDLHVVKALAHVLTEIDGENSFVMFHEEMTILERDKASARFADEKGPMLLIASEIGSEGRNFQFSHNLILFDLPLDAALVEQRIGRLDRIGQNKEIKIHVPYVKGSAQEVMFHWYNEGLDAFGAPLMSGGELFLKYTDSLIEALDDPKKYLKPFMEKVIPLVAKDSATLRKNIEKGRDKLLEFNSRDPLVSKEITDEIKRVDADERLKNLMIETLTASGVEVEKGFVPTSLVFTAGPQVEVGSIPGMPTSSMLTLSASSTEEGEEEKSNGGAGALTGTFDRTEAMAHDEIAFLSFEHPLAQGVIDLATASGKGLDACVIWDNSGSKELIMQYNFIVEPSLPLAWGLSDIAGPKLVRILIDSQGNDCSSMVAKMDAGKVRDTLVPQKIPVVTEKLRYFASTGLALAKRIASKQMEEIAAVSAEKVEERAEQEYQRANHLLTLRGKAANSAFLAELRKNVQEHKRTALQPQIRLDAIRLLVCR